MKVISRTQAKPAMVIQSSACQYSRAKRIGMKGLKRTAPTMAAAKTPVSDRRRIAVRPKARKTVCFRQGCPIGAEPIPGVRLDLS